MTHIPTPPSRAGVGSTSGRSESVSPASGARFSRFWSILGPVFGCSRCGRRAGGTGAPGQKEGSTLHASVCGNTGDTLVTSCGALAELERLNIVMVSFEASKSMIFSDD